MNNIPDQICFRCKVKLNPMAEQYQYRCPVCYSVTKVDPDEYKFEDDPRALKEKDYGRYTRKVTHVSKKTEID